MGKTTENLSLALLAALILHGVLLAQNLVFESYVTRSEKPISVKLLVEKPTKEKPEKEKSEPRKQAVPENAEPQQPEIEKPLPPAVKPPTQAADNLIVATKPSDELDQKITIQSSQRSRVFNNWLQSETKRFSDQNPQSIGRFDHTFNEPDIEKFPEELSHDNPKNLPGHSGQFMVEKGGERYCGAKVDFLLSGDDFGGTGSYVDSEPCPRKQKFDLNLKKPNNGWTNR